VGPGTPQTEWTAETFPKRRLHLTREGEKRLKVEGKEKAGERGGSKTKADGGSKDVFSAVQEEYYPGPTRTEVKRRGRRRHLVNLSNGEGQSSITDLVGRPIS